jgi:hypothetical protein
VKRSRLARIRQLKAVIADPQTDTVGARLQLVELYQDNDYDDPDSARWEALAAAELRAAYEKRRRTLGPDHPETLRLRHRMVAERPAELAEVAAAQERVLGLGHPDTLESLRRSDAGRGELRDRLLAGWRQVLAEREQRLGWEHPETSEARGRVAGLEEPPEAERLRERTVEAWARLREERSERLGPLDPETVVARRAYARLFDDEVRVVEQIAGEHVRAFGPDDPRTLRAQVELAHLYMWNDPRSRELARSLIDRVTDDEDLLFLRYRLSAPEAAAGNLDAMREIRARYPAPSDDDEDLVPGDPGYPATDDDI